MRFGRWTIGSAVAALGLSVAVAACGGGGSSGSTASAASGGGGKKIALLLPEHTTAR